MVGELYTNEAVKNLHILLLMILIKKKGRSNFFLVLTPC
jgi:hypothetical protein